MEYSSTCVGNLLIRSWNRITFKEKNKINAIYGGGQKVDFEYEGTYKIEKNMLTIRYTESIDFFSNNRTCLSEPKIIETLFRISKGEFSINEPHGVEKYKYNLTFSIDPMPYLVNHTNEYYSDPLDVE